MIELEPAYCDVIVQRWQKFTGKEAIHGASGETFAQVSALRITHEAPAGVATADETASKEDE